MAEKGHRVYIASMPLNLAFFGQNKADSFISEHQDRRYVIGGHSLGGVFAARYASEHADVIDGVYFMASYADDGGKLNGLNMSAIQITGTQDGVLDRTEWEAARKNLPDDTTYVDIAGGNHGQFGSYGFQKGRQRSFLNPSRAVDRSDGSHGPLDSGPRFVSTLKLKCNPIETSTYIVSNMGTC